MVGNRISILDSYLYIKNLIFLTSCNQFFVYLINIIYSVISRLTPGQSRFDSV